MTIDEAANIALIVNAHVSPSERPSVRDALADYFREIIWSYLPDADMISVDPKTEDEGSTP